MTALLSVENLVVEYAVGGKTLSAVSDVSLEVGRGETLGLVGESGCGKSTLGRAVLQLRRPTGGKVVFDGTELTGLDAEKMRLMRRRLQLIFQDPIASLNPRRCIGDIVAEPLIITGVTDKAERERRVREVLTAVGLDADLVTGRLPHEFSGGQCQRICIARALILEPELVICDEPVSALDVSIRAQILNLLEDMKRRYGLTLLFIAHDLAVVKAVSDRIAVMYLGRLCEVGPTEQTVLGTGAPLHGAAARGDPRARSLGEAHRQRPGRRAAVAARAAVGLPLPHPLPARRHRVRRRRAALARGGRRPVRGLSSSVDRPLTRVLCRAMPLPCVHSIGPSLRSTSSGEPTAHSYSPPAGRFRPTCHWSSTFCSAPPSAGPTSPFWPSAAVQETGRGAPGSASPTPRPGRAPAPSPRG